MEYKIKENHAEEIFEAIKDFEKLLTERVSDLHQTKGLIQARHAYIFYRERLNNIQSMLKDNLVKDQKN